MTVNVQSLDWDTEHFDARHTDFRGKAVNLDDNTVAIIDHNVDTSTSDLTVGTPETNTWFHSSDPPGLVGARFLRKPKTPPLSG